MIWKRLKANVDAVLARTRPAMGGTRAERREPCQEPINVLWKDRWGRTQIASAVVENRSTGGLGLVLGTGFDLGETVLVGQTGGVLKRGFVRHRSKDAGALWRLGLKVADTERRIGPRVAANSKVERISVNGESWEGQSSISNLSESGLQLRTNTPIPVHAEVRLGEDRSVYIGVVRYCRRTMKGYIVGLDLTGHPPWYEHVVRNLTDDES